MRKDDVENLLETFGQAGLADSTGVFTISGEKSREKLREYQLPNPRLYILNLLSAAVCGGAKAFKVSLHNRTTQVEYDGSPPTENELRDLFTYLLSQRDRKLSELGVALNSCSVFQPRKLQIESRFSGRLVKWVWDGDKPEVSTFDLDGEADTPDSTVLQLEEPPSLTRLAQRFFREPAEIESLKSLGKFAPLELYVNNSLISQSVEIGHTSGLAISWALFHREGVDLRVTPPLSSFSAHCQNSQRTWSEDYDCLLVLDGPESAAHQGLTFVNNGVVFQRENSLLGMPFCSAVVYCSLPKNASHTDLVEQAEFQSLVGKIRELAVETLAERLQQPLPVPDHLVTPLIDWITRFLQQPGEDPDVARSRALKRWLREACFRRDLSNDKLWSAILKEYTELSSREEARRTEVRLRTSLVGGASSAFDGGRYHDCASLLRKLESLGILQKAGWARRAGRDACLVAAVNGDAQIEKDALLEDPGAYGLALRMLNRPADARRFLDNAGERGACFLALEDFDQAEHLLRQEAPLTSDPSTLEALSDLLCFSPGANRERRAEGYRFRCKAVEIRKSVAGGWGDFLDKDLLRLSRGALPFAAWVVNRARGSLMLNRICLEAARVIEDKFEKIMGARKLGLEELVSIKSTILKAEVEFGPHHPVLEAARSKACHILRRFGFWSEADDLWARGKVLELIDFEAYS